MTGKETIFEYLKTHKTFCSADVSAFSGVSHTGINQAASDPAHGCAYKTIIGEVM